MSPLFAFFEGAFSPSHIVVVLVVGILLFGKRLPEVSRSLGKSLMEFKRGLHGLEEEMHGTFATNRPTPPPAPPAPQVPPRIVPPGSAS